MEEEIQSDKNILDSILGKTEDEINPWEQCSLPSRGLYYDGQIPGGIVEIKPLGLQAEKILATQRLVSSGEALEHVFQKHVRLPNNFEHLDLLEGDRDFILYMLRGITHGNEYEFFLTCPHCQQISDQFYDLNDLWDSARTSTPDLGPEPFKVVLPHLSEVAGAEFWVSVRFLRGYDIMDFLNVHNPLHEQQKARNKKKGKKSRAEAVRDKVKEHGERLNDTLEKNINRIIVSVMGDEDRSKVKQVVDRMNSSDISTILDFLSENSPGIDTTIETECGNQKCKRTLSLPLPITDEFFRPKKSRRSR